MSMLGKFASDAVSMFGRLASDAVSVLFPPRCPVCGAPLRDNSVFICELCRCRIPLTGFESDDNNPMFNRLADCFPTEHAMAVFWFLVGSDWRDLVHRFKYGGGWNFALRLGRWTGRLLAKSGRYDEIDVVVPVPLHWRKRLQRGYNQSELLAEGISEVLGAEYDCKSLRRTRHTPPQARSLRRERWRNASGSFTVVRPERLRGKHLLLVDDVFTTGSTVLSCMSEILKATDGDVRISVATLAVSWREFAAQ